MFHPIRRGPTTSSSSWICHSCLRHGFSSFAALRTSIESSEAAATQPQPKLRTQKLSPVTSSAPSRGRTKRNRKRKTGLSPRAQLKIREHLAPNANRIKSNATLDQQPIRKIKFPTIPVKGPDHDPTIAQTLASIDNVPPSIKAAVGQASSSEKKSISNVPLHALKIATGSIAKQTEDNKSRSPASTPQLKDTLLSVLKDMPVNTGKSTKEDPANAKKPKKLPLPPQRRANSRKAERLEGPIKSIDVQDLDLRPIELNDQPAVPNLSYGLDRVLFNPGVYHLQDPRSRVFNFDPYLQNVMKVADFDFNALKAYITSSRDESLKSMAKEFGKKYVGSSSSMTASLAHFHFLLSQWRPISTSMISQGFPDRLRSFTLLQRKPSAIFLRYKDGSYAIDADKEFDTGNILALLGKSLEKLLTLSKDDYERYRKSSEGGVSTEERESPESFHYSTMGDLLMRSQLDAHDERLPGTGMFDLKTRAVVSIRMDVNNYERGTGYEIKSRFGEWESFEREYFDMIRAAFLKYSLQVRMGRMDGIFVAFHNVERIFGFQYISLAEMDQALHGENGSTIGDEEFKLSLALLIQVLDKATAKFPEQSLRIHFETRETTTPFMYIFAEPMTDDQITEIQETNKDSIEAFERETLGLHHEETSDASSDGPDPSQSPSAETSSSEQWSEIQAQVEDALKSDEHPADDRRSKGADSDEAKMDRIEHEVLAQHLNDVALTSQETQVPDEDAASTDNPSTSGGKADQVADGEDDPSSASLRTGAEPREAMEVDSHQDESSDDDRTKGDAERHGDKVWLDGVDEEQERLVADDKRDLLGMTLTVRNKVNSKYVTRPVKLSEQERWSVEYSLSEITSPVRAWSLYGACQTRRRKALGTDVEEDSDAAASFYVRRLREMSEKGREWRREQDAMMAKEGRVVMGGEEAPDGVSS
ncbi:MAG: hypothetical protein M1817_006609 [Caeruleum heppii]|nr:MAG: hypothetical protein M1817_006609 [Caeruleum heppii]